MPPPSHHACMCVCLINICIKSRGRGEGAAAAWSLRGTSQVMKGGGWVPRLQSAPGCGKAAGGGEVERGGYLKVKGIVERS